MADISTARFLQAYGNFLVAAWGGPPLKNRFKRDREKVLKEFGLDPEGAKVVIDPPGPPSSQATPESAAKLWNEGKEGGQDPFPLPGRAPAGPQDGGSLGQGARGGRRRRRQHLLLLHALLLLLNTPGRA